MHPLIISEAKKQQMDKKIWKRKSLMQFHQKNYNIYNIKYIIHNNAYLQIHSR